jgi:hypothetical protein
MADLTIAFDNQAQVILYECELKGQISDGFWENSRPHDHWKKPSAAAAFVSRGNTGPNFYTSRKYNFANRDLLNVVGNRMIAYVKTFTAFPDLPFNQHWDYDWETSPEEIAIETENGLKDPKSNYWWDKAHRVLNAFGVKNVEQLRAKLATINDVEYCKGQMMKDLKRMSEIINGPRRVD